MINLFCKHSYKEVDREWRACKNPRFEQRIIIYECIHCAKTSESLDIDVWGKKNIRDIEQEKRWSDLETKHYSARKKLMMLQFEREKAMLVKSKCEYCGQKFESDNYGCCSKCGASRSKATA